MNWLAGAAWPLALLIAAPLVIHLLSRRPPRPQPFAPLPLLERAIKRERRRIQLRRFLLLACRTLAVAGLCLAALLPMLGQPPSGDDNDRGPVTLVIDGSGSMEARNDGGQRFFDVAIDYAESQAQRRPVALVFCGADGQSFLQDQPIPGLQARTLLEDKKPAGYVDLDACVGGIDGSSLLVTDGWGATTKAEGVHIVSRENERDNAGLGAVRVRPLSRGMIELTVTVHGSPGPRRLQLKKSGVVKSTIRLEVAPHGLGEALLTLRLESGHHRLVLELEEDRWLEDNKRELGLTMQGPTHVLAVNGDARSVDYQDELFYLRQAAHALGARDPFRLTEVSLGDERQAPLQEAQVVLLADNSQLDVAFVAELRAFVERGGGLLVSAGPSMDPVALTKSLGDLLPAPIRSRWMALDVDGRPSKQAATTVSVPEDLEFFDQLGLGRAEGLLRTQVWGGINHQSEGDVRWRLTDGRPLLTTDEKGRGRVALISTSLDRDLSDLAIRPGFVPLLRGLLRWLAGQSAGGLDPDLRRGERFSQTLGAQEVQWVGPEKARARTIVEAGQLRFTPPRLGLWRAKEIELGVELRTDERESRPLSQTQRQALASSGGVGDQGLPLWPLLLILAMLALFAESWLTAREVKAAGH